MSTELASTLQAISDLAPDLIRTEPRTPLYPGGPEFGPLLFLACDLNAQTGMFSAIAHRNTSDAEMTVSWVDALHLLVGLLACCDRLGWDVEVMTEGGTNKARIATSTSFHVARGETRTHALANALLLALRAERSPA